MLYLISTPCNKPADLTLCTWSFFLVNPFTHCSEVYYKPTNYNSTPGSNGYAFRHTKPASVANTTAQPWQVYPNPATVSLTVNNPVTNSADRYSIKNVLGQIVADGSLVVGTHEINVSSLTDGNYIISVYKEGVPTGNTMFVKN